MMKREPQPIILPGMWAEQGQRTVPVTAVITRPSSSVSPRCQTCRCVLGLEDLFCGQCGAQLGRRLSKKFS